jgi:UDP-glucuronate decarboxylase
MHPNDGRVVSNFIVQALHNQPLTIYGEGSQTRSFAYVDDLIEGLVLMMNTEKEVTGPINLGNPSEFTILELAELVIDITGSTSTIEHHPLPVDDPQQRKPDITLAKQILDWRPTVDLETGLKKTVAYFETLFQIK